jgi:acetoin utilization protein AcuB
MKRLERKRLRLRDVIRNAAREGVSGTNLTVAQLMTPSPISVEKTATALDLTDLFYSLRFRHFLVKDESGKLVGLISDHDIVRCFGLDDQPTEERLAQLTAEQIMSTELVAVAPETTITDAVDLMLEHGINSLPVLVDQHPVGIVTSTDLYLLLGELLRSSQPEIGNEADEPQTSCATD